MKTKKWIEDKLISEKKMLSRFEEFLDEDLKGHELALAELHKMEIHCCNIRIVLLNEILENNE